MRQISFREQNALLEILAKYHSRLMGFQGVHHVDVGYRMSGEVHTEELTIRAHVLEKKELSLLSESERLPDRLDDFAVDVIPSAKRKQYILRDRRFEVLSGGIQTGNTRLAPAGTLGLIVRLNGTEEPLGLSNHHVWVRSVGQVGNPVDQPHLIASADVIGSLWDWDANLDCAVAKLNDSRQVLFQQAVEVSPAVTGIATPLVGMPVMKSGIATLLTFGLIDGVGLTGQDFTIVPDPDNPAKYNEISMEGDSGAVWIHTRTREAIGLHHSGETPGYPERAWASRMTNVAEAMNFHI